MSKEYYPFNLKCKIYKEGLLVHQKPFLNLMILTDYQNQSFPISREIIFNTLVDHLFKNASRHMLYLNPRCDCDTYLN